MSPDIRFGRHLRRPQPRAPHQYKESFFVEGEPTGYRNLPGRPLAVGWIILCACLASSTTSALAQPEGFNYDESRVPQFELPDPLRLEDGTRVTDRETWIARRRPEILHLFESEVYGRAPDADGIRSRQFSERPDAIGGKALRREVTVFFSEDDAGPSMDLMIYTPGNARGPVPVFLGLNFTGNHSIDPDPSIRLSTRWMRSGKRGSVDNRATQESRGTSAGRWAVETIIDRGYGLATIYYGDIDPDFDDGFENGVHALFHTPDNPPGPDEWGSIAAWAWGLSRALDYFETDDRIDHDRVAVLGHSRLGKTALWAGARDERFALVISNNSGCGGAALSRRRFGETVKRINTSFPHWFCDNFNNYNSIEERLPVDQHMLISLIAPRPVYIASAEQDRWADPRGEFLSALHAVPVYRLFTDGDPFGADEQPAVNEPVGTTIGYHIRTGKHDVTDYDWQQYLDFADRNLR